MIPNACNASKIHVHIFVIILIHCYSNIIKYIHSFVLANRVESTHYSYYTNKYMDTINANTNEQSAEDTCKVYECNICYDNSVDCEMITLNCCNHTKHICIRCVNCCRNPFVHIVVKKSTINAYNTCNKLMNVIIHNPNQYPEVTWMNFSFKKTEISSNPTTIHLKTLSEENIINPIFLTTVNI